MIKFLEDGTGIWPHVWISLKSFKSSCWKEVSARFHHNVVASTKRQRDEEGSV
jgi:hypothetical protein